MHKSFRNNLNGAQTDTSAIAGLPPALVALLVQLLALSVVLLLVATALLQQWRIFEWAVLQGLIAASISYPLKLSIWWIPIQLLFTPALVATLALALSPLWFFAGFLLIVLIYGKTYQTQVPLFFSSQEAAQALASLLPSQKNFSFIDVGCGYGGLLNKLAEVRPDGKFHGIEAALLPCLLGKFQEMVSTSDKTIRWGDFWQHNLSSYDVVYAYLSPVPMQALWGKACREMRPGSIFISNSFMIPGIRPDKIVELSDFTESALYLWQIRKDTE
jgi:hypothetical protein